MLNINEVMDKTTVLKSGSKRIRLSQFERHYLNEDTKDITIIINGQRIPAHKLILSTRSDFFDELIFGQTKDKYDKEMELKDIPIDTFKRLLKFLYSEELDSNDIKDHVMAIDMYKLSHKFQIKLLSDLIENELIQKINFDNFVYIFEFAAFYKITKLLDTLKEFLINNEKQIIGIFENALVREPLESMDKVLKLLNLSPKPLITALINISNKYPDLDMKKYRILIKFESISIRDINALRNTRMFDDKDLNKLIDCKFEDFVARFHGLSAENDLLKTENEVINGKYVELSNRYVELNNKYIELLANYKEVKDIFSPFVEGIGGRVNQYVYNKTNCYLGKMAKRFDFKY